jgi:hypothetical protein
MTLARSAMKIGFAVTALTVVFWGNMDKFVEWHNNRCAEV